MTKVKNLKDSKILIVGGAGFVGSNYVLIIKNYDPKYILIIDNLLSSTADNIARNKKIKFIYGSIISDEILFQIQKILIMYLILPAIMEISSIKILLKIIIITYFQTLNFITILKISKT